MKSGVFNMIFAIAGVLLIAGCSNVEKPEKHLFILSGQSNMTGKLQQGFTKTVEQAFGQENITVVKSMKSGRGIRFWVKGYQYADGRNLTGKKDASNGQEYPNLLKASKDALLQQKYDTVTFIWMQGESDANSQHGLSKVYGVNFEKLYRLLKKDLDLEKMNFVIGRISNYGLLKTVKNYSPERAVRWHEVREAQVKVAEKLKDGAWINTDDLIDETNLHYLGDKSQILGERFARKAIDLLIENYGNEILNLNFTKDKGEKFQ